MKQTILIVEDEERLANLLADYLNQAGFETHCLHTGSTATEWVRENQPDLIFLDLMLPEKDGLEICREVRTFSNVSIIMVTARSEEIDRLVGLEIGADDYICKPFSYREAVARARAVLRRGKHPQQPLCQEIFIDEEKYQAKILGHELDLTTVEFTLLKVLAANPDRVFSRDHLMSRIYTDGRLVSDRTIDSHISKLRRKIADVLPGKDIISSVYSAGYKLNKRALTSTD